MEEWKTLTADGFAGIYEVSSLGRIRRIIDGRGTVAGRIMQPSRDRKGYLTISLRGEKGSKTFKVHRLVALAFVPGDHSLHVGYKHGDKDHPTAAELEWLSPAASNERAIRTGSWKPMTGAKHPRGHRVLSDDQITAIRELASRGMRPVAISRELGIRYGNVWNVVRGNTWEPARTDPS